LELYTLDDVTQSEDSFFDSDDAMSPSSHSFADQLNGKFADGSNSVFIEMSRLALLAMTKEQENKDLKEHILVLKQQVSAAKSNKILELVNVSIIIFYYYLMHFRFPIEPLKS
jgi:hypothetical protein